MLRLYLKYQGLKYGLRDSVADKLRELRDDESGATAIEYGLIAAGIAEVDLAVLDDRVVPIGDVDGAVGPHLDVDRPKGGVLGFDQLDLLARGVSAAVLADHESAAALGTELVRNHGTAPRGRQSATAAHC